MGTTDVIGSALSIVEGLNDPAMVNTFLVVVSYLAFLKMTLRAWEQKVIAPGPRPKARRRKKQ
ncbi:hypothetical protein ATI61_10991 [Archangium gephyra]|uniref:Uncharacterized protein n=1 Tax=Archangium gephyra TaxID=48 RepID=A0ABX9JVD0_9BACT|nr:hypothetical protein ATI61_10991 [Archangium gephyra]